MDDNNRSALVAYRLQQANESSDLVLFLIENEKLTVAVNRIYYGMFFALTALALAKKFETSKHNQLIGWFNKEFVATNKTNTKYGKIIRNAYTNRTKGDYDAFITFEKEEVIRMHHEMIEFIAELKRIIENQ